MVKENETLKTVISFCPICRMYFNGDLSETLYSVNRCKSLCYVKFADTRHNICSNNENREKLRESS